MAATQRVRSFFFLHQGAGKLMDVQLLLLDRYAVLQFLQVGRHIFEQFIKWWLCSKLNSGCADIADII